MTVPAPAPLEIEGLTVRLGTRTALEAVDLTVRAGEFVALTGPNGSGKTTLIRAALGLQPAQAGSVRLFGDAVEELRIRDRALRAAWVPQEESARDNVPVSTYVSYGRFARLGPFDSEGPEDRARAVEALAAAGLSDRAQDGILELSGGERQRLVLARALAQDAPLLLLDEPTSHLDIGHQLDLLDRVRTLARDRGLAVLAALHDLNLAARFSDRIVVLSHGRVVAAGAPAEVLSGTLLRTVWGVAADLRKDVRTGVPYLVPRLPSERAHDPGPSGGWGPVHVVGGGGSAAPWLRLLVEHGYRVTAGALHLLDSDAETAESLGIPTALEVPFAPLSAPVRAQHRALIEEARAVVVAPFAVGPSNLANLEEVVAVRTEIPIFLVGPGEDAALDFCGGRAQALREALRARGALPASGPAELIALLRQAREKDPGAPGPLSGAVPAGSAPP